MAIAAVLAYRWSESEGYAQLEQTSAHQLDLYVSGLESELDKHQFLPNLLLELDANFAALLDEAQNTGQAHEIGKRLARLSIRAGCKSIFLADRHGTVRAASDWYQPDSMQGRNIAREGYFTESLKGEQVRFFSPDLAGGKRKFYFAQAVRRQGHAIGVVVVEISLEPIEAVWTASIPITRSEKLLVVDESNLIIISSVPDWKYRDTPLIQALNRFQSFPDEPGVPPVRPMGMTLLRPLAHGGQLARLPPDLTPADSSNLFVVQAQYMVRSGWYVVTFTDASAVLLNARRTALGAGAVTALFGLLSMYIRQRRKAMAIQQAARRALQKAHDELEVRVLERTAELHASNLELLHEIAERKRTEQHLRETRDELIQAGKLALLGQMSAGITHEINQPLTALRSLSHNTRLLLGRGQIDKADKNLLSIADLTERMSRITAQLKSFVRKAPLHMEPVRLAASVENVLLLLEGRIHSEKIALSKDIPPALHVLCDSLRLEQVLINLLANAMDAMQASATRQLTIEVRQQEQSAIVRIVDSGPGIPDEIMARLFEPFLTTKPQGKGLGLGLVISSTIVQEFGGVLSAANTPAGTVFEFDLRTAEVHSNV
jgi:two-component system C4-dicarboxylate transport sensor histidine kinase DctB